MRVVNGYRYLEQYEQAEQRADRLRREYNEEMQKIDSLRSSLGDGTPRGGTISRTVEHRAVKLADKAAELKEAEADALWIRQQVFALVDKIPDPEGSVLFERYVMLKKWEQVAFDLGYSVRQCHNLRKKGIRMVENMLEQTIS